MTHANHPRVPMTLPASSPKDPEWHAIEDSKPLRIAEGIIRSTINNLIIKEFTKTALFCQVKFELLLEVNVHLACLDRVLNDWEQLASLLKPRKDGRFNPLISLNS